MTDASVGANAPRRAWSGAQRAVLAVGAMTGVALLALPVAAPAAAAGLALYALVAWIVLDRLARWHPAGRFGAGNRVTLVRAGGVAVLAALALAPTPLAGSAAWAALAGCTVLLALDGIDGWLARRDGTASAFGARFDMEVDALLILVLAGLALDLGKAGPWVLALGLLRYGFALAGAVWPAFARPLPPSFRRKAVCVLQVAVLSALLAPPMLPPLSGALAAGALAALAWSFVVDIRWLSRQVP